MMNTCKSCKTQLLDDANKCPHCYAFQTWYKNPQVYYMLFFVPFFIVMYWNLGIFNQTEFIDFQDDFLHSQINIVESKDAKAKLITFNIKNNTKHKWEDIQYQVVSKDDEKVLAAYSDMEFGWAVQPNSESLLTARVPNVPGANQWELKINDMDNRRY